MEPKDLKNSSEELSDAINASEIIDDQDVTGEAELKSEVTEVVEEPVEESTVVSEESIAHADEQSEEQDKTESIAEVEVEKSEPEVELVQDIVNVIEDEIPSIEELIEVSEEDLEIHEDDLLDENSPKLKLSDYADLDEAALTTELRNLLSADDFETIKDDVDAIKINFFKLYRSNVEAQKAAFVEAGGDIENFKTEPDQYELEFRSLLKIYQDRRNEHNKKVDESKESNLKRKYEIIEEIKALINNKESINKTFHDFRDLQETWRNIGQIPQAKLKDLWKTYNQHLENF